MTNIKYLTCEYTEESIFPIETAWCKIPENYKTWLLPNGTILFCQVKLTTIGSESRSHNYEYLFPWLDFLVNMSDHRKLNREIYLLDMIKIWKNSKTGDFINVNSTGFLISCVKKVLTKLLFFSWKCSKCQPCSVIFHHRASSYAIIHFLDYREILSFCSNMNEKWKSSQTWMKGS